MNSLCEEICIDCVNAPLALENGGEIFGPNSFTNTCVSVFDVVIEDRMHFLLLVY